MKEQMVAAFTEGWKHILHVVCHYTSLDIKLNAELKRDYTNASGKNEFFY